MKKLAIILLLFASLALGAQLSFNSGQQSPLMKYRVDVDNRSMAAETLQNIVVSPQGMAAKRPGTEFIDNSTTDDNVRLIPFEYSTGDAYVLEFSHEQIGFFRTTQ